MNDDGGDVIEQTVRIGARPETVWRFWTDPSRICEWWGSAARLDPRPGGVYEVEMNEGPLMRGEYIELVPFERIVFTFGWEPAPGAPNVAPGSSRVEVTFTADAGDTILTLRHTGLPHVEVDAHRTGWVHFLSHLVGAVRSSAQQGAQQ